MKIGEIASLASVPTKTIRYYESIGLLPEPPRSENGYRDYGPETVERLRFIKDAQAMGLTLAEIDEVLGLRRSGRGTCTHVVALLDQHLSDLDRQIEALHRTRLDLVRLTDNARSLDPSDCDDPGRCQTIVEGLHEAREPLAVRKAPAVPKHVHH